MADFVKMVEATLKDDRDRFFNFLSLVKRMREAQKSFNNIRFIDKSSESYKDAKKSRKQLESEVDEYLKKMEI